MKTVQIMALIQSQQNLQVRNIEVKMSLNLPKNRQTSLEQSRVSSSSSNNSQHYELIPRQDPFFSPTRDVASPKASFPFRKVQAGNQSSNAIRIQSESKSSIKSSVKDQSQSKEQIGENGQLNSSKKFPSSQKSQEQGLKKSVNHIECQTKIQNLGRKIEQLEQSLNQQKNQYDFSEKANEIYTQAFSKIRQLIRTKSKTFEGQSIEQLVQKLEQILNSNSQNGNQLIEQQDKKIQSLRAQLLKSTQNNINAIFNTEISEAYCLQHQIQKMNSQIVILKQKLIKAAAESHENLLKVQQGKLTNTEIRKIVKIYKQKLDSESENEQINQQITRKKGKRTGKHKQRKESSSSEKSSSSRNKHLISTQNKMSEMIEGYKYFRDHYAKFDQTLKQINDRQQDFKQMFKFLKKDITLAIQNKIKQVKSRPSSNHQQIRIAKQMQSKLNDLVNTLNAPEKVNRQKSVEQQPSGWKNVQTIKKIRQLQSINLNLQQRLRKLDDQKCDLQNKILNISKFYTSKNRQQKVPDLFLNIIEDKKKRSNIGDYREQFPLTSRSDIREQHIHEQLSVGQGIGNVVQTSSFNKHHSSQSHHQSSSKNTEIQHLHFRYEQKLRQKDLRIIELQNTILDHIQPKPTNEPLNLSEKFLKQNYQHYINNLKMLLSQSRRQYQVLKSQFIKTNQINLSRVNADHDRNSITLSDRTTKNCIAQTRLIQRRSPKSTFENAKAVIQVENSLERLYLGLYEFIQKIKLYEIFSRETVFSSAVVCLKQIILEAKQRNYKLYEDIIHSQDTIIRLRNIGIELS